MPRTRRSGDSEGRLGDGGGGEKTPCVIYARVSTAEQAEGYSLAAQLNDAEDFAAKKHLDVVQRFVEAESAAKPGRPEFGRMLCFLRDNPSIKTVVVHKLDRMARNFTDFATLDDLGVHMRCVVGDIPDSPQGMLLRDILAALARNYSVNLSHEVTKGQREKARQGGWLTRAPIGYLNDKANRTLVVDPTMGPLMTEAFERYSTGLLSITDLAEEMYAKGLRNLDGGRVHRATLHKALSNPAYCGKVVYRGEVYPGSHQPLVSIDLFDAVQSGFSRNRTNNAEVKHRFVLRDFLYCSECGCKITAGQAKGHVYYRCTRAKGRDVCAQKAYIREEHLVDQISHILDQIAIPDSIVQALLEEARLADETRASGLAARLSAIERSLSRNQQRSSSLLDLRLDGSLDDDSFAAKQAQLREERTTLLLKRRELETEDQSAFPQVERLAKLGAGASFAFQAGSDAQKREVLAAVLCYLRVKDGNIGSYQYKRPFEALLRDPEGAFCLAWSG